MEGIALRYLMMDSCWCLKYHLKSVPSGESSKIWTPAVLEEDRKATPMFVFYAILLFMGCLRYWLDFVKIQRYSSIEMIRDCSSISVGFSTSR